MQTDNEKLVIFDCDGVLVDSEPISISVLADAIIDAGGEISMSDAYDKFLGRSLSTIIGMLNADYHLNVGEEFLDAMRTDLYGRFRAELLPVSGISGILTDFGRKFCVASSSQPERIRLSLSLTGLIDHFEPNIFSATMVQNGKPAPDLFLFAADKMGSKPQDCIVIEDSPAGIVAARSAGMQVFAFVGASHAGKADLRNVVESLNPTLIFDDMSQLPALLSAVGS